MFCLLSMFCEQRGNPDVSTSGEILKMISGFSSFFSEGRHCRRADSGFLYGYFSYNFKSKPLIFNASDITKT